MNFKAVLAILGILAMLGSMTITRGCSCGDYDSEAQIAVVEK